MSCARCSSAGPRSWPPSPGSSARRPTAGAASPSWSARRASGKSRLAREAAGIAADRGLLVLAGRSVPEASPLPFRPLSEALLVASRGQRPAATHPSSPGSAPSSAGSCRTGGRPPRPAPPTTPRCCSARRWSGCCGCSAAPPGACSCWRTCTGRTRRRWRSSTTSPTRSPPSGCCAWPRPGRSGRRGPRTCSTGCAAAGSATVLPLAPLPDAECARMVRACLAGADVDRRRARLRRRAQRRPAVPRRGAAGRAWSPSGALRRDGRRVACRAGGPRPSVPASFAESMRTPAADARRDARQVLAAAAVLGRRFDWDLLPGVAEVDGRRSSASLRRAVDAQLVAVDGQRFRFRHALTREAVLAELLPPERGRAVRAGARRGRAGAPRPARPVVRAGRRARRGGRGPGGGGGAHGRERPARPRPRRAGQRRADGRTRPAAGSGRVGGRGRGRRGAGDVLVARREARAGAGDSGTRCCARSTSWAHRPTGGWSSCSLLARAALAAGDADAAAADVASAPGRRAGSRRGSARRARRRRRARRPGRRPARRGTAARVGGRRRRADRPEVECEALEVLGPPGDGVRRRWPCFRAGRRPGGTARADDLAAAGPPGARPDRGDARRRPRPRPAPGRGRRGRPRHGRPDGPGPRRHGAGRVRPRHLPGGGGALCRRQPPLRAREPPGGAALARRGACARRARDGDGGRAGRGRRRALPATRGSRPTPGAACARPTTRCARTATRCARHSSDRWSSRASPRRWSRCTRGSTGGRCCTPCPTTTSACPPGPRSRRPGSSGPGSATPRSRLVDAVVLGRQGRGRRARAPLVDRARTAIGERDWSWYSLRLVAEAAVRDGWGEPVRWLREAEAFFADARLRPGRPRMPDPARRGGRAGRPPRAGPVDRSPGPAPARHHQPRARRARPRRRRAAHPRDRRPAVPLPETVEHHVASLFARTGARTALPSWPRFARANRVAPPP